MDSIINLPNIHDYDELLGAPTLHPLVNVVDMSTLGPIEHHRMNRGFYCIFLKDLDCGELLYGRSRYDYQEGTMVFIGPGQVAGVADGGVTEHPKGWILMFHPDFIHGTSLARSMRSYSFFSYSSNEALHISERERHVVLNCLEEIRQELSQNIDRHTRRIVTSYIETLLNHCTRFYERQFVTREITNRDVLARFETVLQQYLDSDRPLREGLPSVQYCAEQVFLSPNYFGDLIKKETGKSPREYIQQAVVDRAKEMLMEGRLSVSEIAYKLGFSYPHHLNRMFKKVTSMTPNEFRKTAI